MSSRGTTRPSSRGRRGAASAPGSRTAARARRRVELRAAAGRSASSCPRRSRPSKPVSSAIVSASSRIDVSTPVPRLTGAGAVVPLGREQQRLGAVVDVEELARRRAVAPEHDLAGRVEHLADQRRDHVRRLRGRSCRAARRGSPGSRKIASSAVLLAIGLRADEHGLLGDAVRRVRLLRVAVPELVLARTAPA